MNNKNDIFVQIASYRDPQLIPTLKNLIDNADSPKNVKVVVCWQHSDTDTIEDFLDSGFDIESHDTISGDEVTDLIYNEASVRLIHIHYLNTQGACWARNKVQQFYNDERYTLQLDSHHRFIDHWDSELIAMLEELRSEDTPKPLLTAYIPSFDPENDPNGRVMEPWKMNFDRFIPEGAVFFMPSTIDNWQSLKRPLRARFYSAHFAFADGSFASEVQHDPEYFFHGEEISIAVRAFTHGYDLFHPNKVIAWHEYTRKNRVKVWDDHTTPEKNQGKIKLDWVERNNSCHLRNRILFGMDGLNPESLDFGKYGFGKKRTLTEYERYAGISFEARSVQQNTLDNLEPARPKDTDIVSDEEWTASLIRSNDLRILIHRNELGDGYEDCDFWYVGCHDDDYQEVFRKDKTSEDLVAMLSNPGEWFDFRLIYLDNRIAKTYTVWPHSPTKGWLNRIVKNVD